MRLIANGQIMNELRSTRLGVRPISNGRSVITTRITVREREREIAMRPKRSESRYFTWMLITFILQQCRIIHYPMVDLNEQIGYVI